MNHRRKGLLALGIIFLITSQVEAGTNFPKKIVHFPQGQCASGQIEVQIYDYTLDSSCDPYNTVDITQDQCFKPYAAHPQIQAGQCMRLTQPQASRLRARCINPGDPSVVPSEWVGPAQMNTIDDAGVCTEILP